jgi:hypothetical protein
MRHLMVLVIYKVQLYTTLLLKLKDMNIEFDLTACLALRRIHIKVVVVTYKLCETRTV